MGTIVTSNLKLLLSLLVAQGIFFLIVLLWVKEHIVAGFGMSAPHWPLGIRVFSHPAFIVVPVLLYAIIPLGITIIQSFRFFQRSLRLKGSWFRALGAASSAYMTLILSGIIGSLLVFSSFQLTFSWLRHLPDEIKVKEARYHGQVPVPTGAALISHVEDDKIHAPTLHKWFIYVVEGNLNTVMSFYRTALGEPKYSFPERSMACWDVGQSSGYHSWDVCVDGSRLSIGSQHLDALEPYMRPEGLFLLPAVGRVEIDVHHCG